MTSRVIAIALVWYCEFVLIAQAPPTALIVNSGSTNTFAFRIEVSRSGDADYTEIAREQAGQTRRPKTVHVKLPPDLTNRFFSDLAMARPLDALPAARCAKSASFGSRTTVEFAGEQTPDLSCPAARDKAARNENVQALSHDVSEIVAAFHIDASKRPLTKP